MLRQNSTPLVEKGFSSRTLSRHNAVVKEFHSKGMPYQRSKEKQGKTTKTQWELKRISAISGSFTTHLLFGARSIYNETSTFARPNFKTQSNLRTVLFPQHTDDISAFACYQSVSSSTQQLLALRLRR